MNNHLPPPHADSSRRRIARTYSIGVLQSCECSKWSRDVAHTLNCMHNAPHIVTFSSGETVAEAGVLVRKGRGDAVLA